MLPRSSESLRRLKRRRKALADAVSVLGKEIAGLESALRAAGFKPQREARRPNAARLNDVTAADAAAEVLRGGPMQLTEIVQAITRRRLYRTPAKDPRATIAKALAKDGRFRRVAVGRYQLRRKSR